MLLSLRPCKYCITLSAARLVFSHKKVKKCFALNCDTMGVMARNERLVQISVRVTQDQAKWIRDNGHAELRVAIGLGINVQQAAKDVVAKVAEEVAK